MRKTVKNAGVVVIALLMLFTLAACTSIKESESTSEATRIVFELTSTYDETSPFIDERLFTVTNSLEALDLGVSFEMQGESGLLEIANNKTKEILWSDTWNGDVARTQFTIPLTNLDKDKEYVIRFTGTEIEHASIVVTGENGLIVERQRPE